MTLLPRIVSAMGLEPGPIAMNKARKVLEAIREPTPEMIAEAKANLTGYPRGPVLAATYTAMIDAALKE